MIHRGMQGMTKIMVICLWSDVSTKQYSSDKDCLPHRRRCYWCLGFGVFFSFPPPELNNIIQTFQLSQSVNMLLWVNWIFNGTLICLIGSPNELKKALIIHLSWSCNREWKSQPSLSWKVLLCIRHVIHLYVAHLYISHVCSLIKKKKCLQAVPSNIAS